MKNNVKNLIEFIDHSPSCFHVIENARKQFLEHGFMELKEKEYWDLEEGKSYFVTRNGSSIIAFHLPKKDFQGFHIVASHSDSPTYRIKEQPEMSVEKHYTKLNIERYGGMIPETWFDRPLSVAGRIIIEENGQIKDQLVNIDRDLMIIPNLAIHMNRDVNKGVGINNQVDLMPVLDSIPEDERTTDYFLSFLARELSVEKGDIIDFELNTFCMEEPCFVGVNDTMISSPRIDNQSSCRALLDAIEDGNRADGINIIALFDHEEIGSSSKQGAASIMLHDMLRRILRNMDLSENEIDESIYDAMLLSVDVAHALHPNKKEKMDITNKPVMGKGFCIKQACSQSYATDAQAIAILCQLCDEKGIPYQRFVNRSDSRGGSTLGSIAGTLLPVKTVDIGIPILAMHSACELMGVRDMKALSDCVTAFFGYH
jgi:aspartyl aminopeptidase